MIDDTGAQAAGATADPPHGREARPSHPQLVDEALRRIPRHRSGPGTDEASTGARQTGSTRPLNSAHLADDSADLRPGPQAVPADQMSDAETLVARKRAALAQVEARIMAGVDNAPPLPRELDHRIRELVLMIQEHTHGTEPRVP